MMGTVEPGTGTNPDVLGHLLHSLCQPLTTLRCSLELTLDEFNERQCESVCAALEQADRAIETVELMREYLELERGDDPAGPVALTSAVHAVLEQLSVVAEANRVPLLGAGTSAAVLIVSEFWLQRALRYLIGGLIETQAPGNAVIVLLEDHPTRALLSAHGLSREPLIGHQTKENGVASHLRQARLAIAQRVFESAGASLALYSGEQSGFAVRLPRAKPLVHKMSA